MLEYDDKSVMRQNGSSLCHAVTLHWDICTKCGVTVSGLVSYINRYHYHLEFLERARNRLGANDNLLRECRLFSAAAVLQAWKCCREANTSPYKRLPMFAMYSYFGLEHHLLFYHRDLVGKCIKIWNKVVRQ